MRKEDVKKNLLNHSEAKVNLLGEYINRYLNIICNDGFTSRIKVYDLFCGEGVYENRGEGSPIVIMRAVKNVYCNNVAKKSLTTKIDCFFNDIDQMKVENTKSKISENDLYSPNFGKLNFSSIDYKDYLRKLIPELENQRNEKAFIFIDPYEYKHIKIRDIIDLMTNRNSEVLLWLPTQFMYRFETNGTPTALKDFITEIVPYENWKYSSSVWKFIDELKNGFQHAIGNNFFVDNFTIQKNNSTVFCLFFFTSHIKGFEKMLESKWKIDTEQGKGWNYTGNQPSLFHQTKTNPLADKLEKYIKEKRRCNGEIYEFTLRQGFLPKHTTEIFIDWQKTGKLRVILNDGGDARKRSFYISYHNFKNEFRKVDFIIK